MRRPAPSLPCVGVWLLLVAVLPATAGVRINEIHYRPKNESTAEEFIELWNHGKKTVFLAGWRLDRGVDFFVHEPSAAAGHRPRHRCQSHAARRATSEFKKHRRPMGRATGQQRRIDPLGRCLRQNGGQNPVRHRGRLVAPGTRAATGRSPRLGLAERPRRRRALAGIAPTRSAIRPRPKLGSQPDRWWHAGQKKLGTYRRPPANDPRGSPLPFSADVD